MTGHVQLRVLSVSQKSVKESSLKSNVRAQDVVVPFGMGFTFCLVILGRGQLQLGSCGLAGRLGAGQATETDHKLHILFPVYWRFRPTYFSKCNQVANQGFLPKSYSPMSWGVRPPHLNFRSRAEEALHIWKDQAQFHGHSHLAKADPLTLWFPLFDPSHPKRLTFYSWVLQTDVTERLKGVSFRSLWARSPARRTAPRKGGRRGPAR